MSLIQVIKIDKRGLDCVNSLWEHWYSQYCNTWKWNVLSCDVGMARRCIRSHSNLSFQKNVIEVEGHLRLDVRGQREEGGRRGGAGRGSGDCGIYQEEKTSSQPLHLVSRVWRSGTRPRPFWRFFGVFFFTFIIWYVRTVLLLLQGLLQEVLLTPRHLLQVQVWQEWLYHHQWDKELHTLSSDKVPPGQNLCSGQWGAGLVWSTNQIQSWSISCSSLFLSQRFTASVIEYFLLNLFFHLTSPAFLIYTYHHLLRIVRGCVYRMCTRRVLPKKMNLKNCNWNLA